jgi:chromosome segregation ATPase
MYIDNVHLYVHSDLTIALDKAIAHSEHTHKTLRHPHQVVVNPSVFGSADKVNHDATTTHHYAHEIDDHDRSHTATMMMDQLHDMNERLDILMSENSLLVEQVSLHESELDECRRDLTERDAQLLTMSQNLNQASMAIQEIREQHDQCQRHKQKAEAQVQQFAATIAQLEAQKESMGAQIERQKDVIAQYDVTCCEAEAKMAALKQSHDQKQVLITKRYQGVCERLRELTSALDSKDKLVDELQVFLIVCIFIRMRCCDR